MKIGKPYSNYRDRCIYLNLESLEYRRIKYDLFLTYKIIYKLVDLPATHVFFQFIRSCYNLRKPNSMQIVSNYYSKRSNTPDYLNNFFSNRVVPVWNSLPEDAVMAGSLPAFRASLSRLDLSAFL